MKKVRYLDIKFENDIKAWEVPFFRGAVSKIAGPKHMLFHNHDNTKNKLRYAYPLIQYKRIGKKPHLICIEEGVDEVHHFFENKQEGLILNNRPYTLNVESINLDKITLQAWDNSFSYLIQDWLPLSQKNYKEYKLLNSQKEQFKFLEKILIGNILSFAKGLNWNVDREIKVNITEQKRVMLL